ncbi:hypothetical protein ABMA27_001729 [Loxostege sticticalis]|uniref:Gag protein n=1 Tax=Loxostege sticticalis TaxID=481309 RepID=A0ABR3HZI8_LOXSC
MGKRKRSSKDDDSEMLKSFLKKVKKLVRKKRKLSSSSSEDEPAPTLPSPAQSPQLDLASDLEQSDEIPITDAPIEAEPIDCSPDLHPDILALLGTDPSQDKSFGEDLHKDLATRWKHVLINGLPKDEKCELLKRYLPAENCAYMKAPRLNPEVKSALSEISYKKDAYSEQKQNQMSSCIAAIGKALNLALSQTENIPQEIVKTLSDAGRLLCDTHYRESLSRRYTIINSISKQKRDVIKNTKIDEFLFGSDLSEHLRSSKAISKSASELKIKYNQQQYGPSTSAALPTLNARGAPRGQTAAPRVNPGQPRRQLSQVPPPAPPPAPRAPPAPRDRRRDPITTRPNYRQQNRRR